MLRTFYRLYKQIKAFFGEIYILVAMRELIGRLYIGEVTQYCLLHGKLETLNGEPVFIHHWRVLCIGRCLG